MGKWKARILLIILLAYVLITLVSILSIFFMPGLLFLYLYYAPYVAPLLGVISLIFGIFMLRKVKERRALAISYIVIGIIFIVFFALILIPVRISLSDFQP